MSNKRTAPVVEFPFNIHDPDLGNVTDILKVALGFVTSLVTLALLLSNTGIVFTAVGGAGTTVLSGVTSIDFEDALIDDVRLILYGSHSTGFQSKATIYDVTDSKQLASVDLPAVAGLVVGEWTKISASAGDHQLELRLIGDGADGQTIYNVTLQCRTTQL